MKDAHPGTFPAGASVPSGHGGWFEFLVENVQDIITVIETDGTILYESPSITENLGYTPTELIGQNAFSLIPEEELPALMEVFSSAVANPDEPPKPTRFRFRHANGTFRFLEARAKVIVSESGQPVVVVTSRDVTDRVEAEEALRRSEERHRALLGAIPDAMVRMSRDGDYLDVAIPHGYRPVRPAASLIGQNVRDVFASEVAELAIKQLERAIDTGETTQFEYEILIDGQLITREARIVKSGDQEAISIQRDITERKKTESALRQSEASFRALFENSPDAIFVEDADGFVLDANPAAAALHGVNSSELIGKHVAELVPEDLRRDVKTTFAELIGSAPTSFESESLGPGGKRVPVEISVNAFTFADRPALLLTVRDISRRKEAEAEIVRLENFYRTILDELPADLAVLDRDGRMIYLNPSSVSDPELRSWLIGRTGHDYCRRRGLDTAIADRRVAFIQEAADSKETVSFEEKLVDRNGDTRHILRLASPIVEPDGSVQRIIGYGLDVTELKRAQFALRESEALLRSVVSSMPMVVIATGRNGTVRLMEGQGLELLGLEPGSGFGRYVNDVLSKLPDVALGFEEALAGKPRNRRIEVNGYTFEFRYSPLHPAGDDTEFSGAVAVGADITDITRRKQAIRESREQLRDLANHLETIREEERTRIAREVHDVLGQAMTALRMDVASLARGLEPKQEELRSRTDAMGRLIKETIRNVRRIATELRPGVLDDLGLAAAIQWQAREFENRTEIACIVSDETDEIQLNLEQSTAVFRIFQEILTNVARHSRASSVEVRIRQEDGSFELRATDDGIGIREEDVSGRSLGLLGIRERVSAWGGNVTFKGKEGKGTVVRVVIPVENSEL
ncbi:MAG: PAS domain S-box protein [Rhodothermia bacterium]|nr:PAS domain S-box protein [Rhodothermia bacterium]